jgi:hypothetical protein
MSFFTDPKITLRKLPWRILIAVVVGAAAASFVYWQRIH